MKKIMVFCNAPDPQTADTLASALVSDGLAACVNLLAPCRSVYRWEGRVEHASEVPMLIKTTEAAYAALEQRLCALHPYRVPEVIACEIVHGLPGYLTWVEQSVFSREPDA